VSNLVLGALTKYPDGSYQIPVTYRVTNIGDLPAPGGWQIGYFIKAGAGAAFDDNAQELYGYQVQTQPLAVSANIDVSTTVFTVRGLAIGPYTVFVKADAIGQRYSEYDGRLCSNAGMCLLRGWDYYGTGLPTTPGRISEELETNHVSAGDVTVN
jgi:hypothetical protein